MTVEPVRYSAGGFVQMEICQGRPNENLATLRKALKDNPPKPDSLIVLPELWASGFDYQQLPLLADKTPAILKDLKVLAGEYQISLAGSLAEKDDTTGVLYNTLFICTEQGVVGNYRKHQLFDYWQEDKHFSPGLVPNSIQTEKGMIASLVCYDLRFPEIARHQCQQGADLILVSAQWPAGRIEQWRVLLKARAIENQVFLIACNGSGKSADLELGGHSMVIAPDGEVLLEAGLGPAADVVSFPWERQKELRDRFNTVSNLPYASDDCNKVISVEECRDLLRMRQRQGQQVVFTNGCFDILHAGHVDYLEKARKQGDFLVLGLNSDSSIRLIKGEARPVNPEEQRARVLAALGCVDAVVLFSEDTPLNLIKALRPSVLVKGADWQEEEIVGAKEVKKTGGRVERIAFTNDTSTTGMIEKIQRGR